MTNTRRQNFRACQGSFNVFTTEKKFLVWVILVKTLTNTYNNLDKYKKQQLSKSSPQKKILPRFFSCSQIWCWKSHIYFFSSSIFILTLKEVSEKSLYQKYVGNIWLQFKRNIDRNPLKTMTYETSFDQSKVFVGPIFSLRGWLWHWELWKYLQISEQILWKWHWTFHCLNCLHPSFNLKTIDLLFLLE